MLGSNIRYTLLLSYTGSTVCDIKRIQCNTQLIQSYYYLCYTFSLCFAWTAEEPIWKLDIKKLPKHKATSEDSL